MCYFGTDKVNLEYNSKRSHLKNKTDKMNKRDSCLLLQQRAVVLLKDQFSNLICMFVGVWVCGGGGV